MDLAFHSTCAAALSPGASVASSASASWHSSTASSRLANGTIHFSSAMEPAACTTASRNARASTREPSERYSVPRSRSRSAISSGESRSSVGEWVTGRDGRVAGASDPFEALLWCVGRFEGENAGGGEKAERWSI